MKMNIDLGQKDGMCCPCDAPSKTEGPRVYYPGFHYEGDEELDLPESGEMTIRFVKTGSSENTNRDGKTRYSCSIEVRKIVSVEGNGEEQKSASKITEEALDALREKLAEEGD
jgi:hypothetical protein